MSDHMASFVAAVLHDRAVADVIKENDELQESQSKAARVEITGEAGSPVYASGDIRRGAPGGRGERWHVALSPNQECTCPLGNLASVQIRLGGIPLLPRDGITGADCGVLDFIRGCWDKDNRYGLFELSDLRSLSVGDISCRCGPFEDYEHYSTIDADQNPFLGAHMVLLAATNPTMSIRFESVAFELPNMLDCLERFGISRGKATLVNLEREDGADMTADIAAARDEQIPMEVEEEEDQAS